MPMDRRTFVKLLGGAGALTCLGLLLGCKPAPTEETPPPMPAAGPEPGAEPAGEVAVVACPKCGAENKVAAWGQEITCWKCGHKWTPRKPA